MNVALRKVLLEEIDGFSKQLLAYTAGEMEKKEYKGISGGFGSYAQREGNRHMLRLRLTGGQVSREQLGFLADCVSRHGIRRLKLTTCQSIQLHDLQPEALVDCMRRALGVDIVTRGGGGDFPRNVMASPLSGAQPGEYFDVQPMARAAADYLLDRMGAVRLPRKLKVCFAASSANETHATFRDLGFVARADGRFDVYCAGGLGPNPRLGVLVAEGVDSAEILCHLEAMLQTFARHGNFENRAKARTRYLQESLGEEGVRRVYGEALAQAKGDGVPRVEFSAQPVEKRGADTLSHPRALAQKQPGLYTVTYRPVGGMLAAELPGQLYALSAGMEAIEWRVGPDGSLSCLHLTADEARQVLAATPDGAQTLFEQSVACIGASVCQQGARDSQKTLAALVSAARQAGFADGVLPRIRISGCPSSCGAQQAGALGLQGGVKLVEGRAHPAYSLLVDGSATAPNSHLGTALGSILEADLPAFFRELGQMVADSGGKYASWYPAHGAEFAALVTRYTA